MSPHYRPFSILSLIAALGLSTNTAQAQVPAQVPAQAPAAAGAAAAANVGYRLGPGDKLRVTTFGENSLTGEFLVDGSGMVSFPLVGNLRAGGLTGQAFQGVIEAALREGYIREPRVSVEVLTYRPFFILGEVNKPGTYAYSDGLTVLNAVATAEGFTYRANQRRVYIKRAGRASEELVTTPATTMIGPGDTVRIVERFF